MMNAVLEFVPLLGLMIATGAAAGLLAGLLGVGGGIVIVPVLEFALGLLGVDPAIRMHVAVATSLATIIPTSLSSSRAHHRREAVDFSLMRRWAGPIFLGAVIGVWAAAQVDSRVLSVIFGVVAALVAVKMMLPLDNKQIADDVPRGILSPVLPIGIGAVSSMMGIGGGTVAVPLMTLMGQSVHRAVGTAALFGLFISLPGTFGFMVAGWDVAGRPPGSVGYVNLVGFLIISPMTVWIAPLGAKVAHALTARMLSVLFGLFLFVVALRMFVQAFG